MILYEYQLTDMTSFSLSTVDVCAVLVLCAHSKNYMCVISKIGLVMPTVANRKPNHLVQVTASLS